MIAAMLASVLLSPLLSQFLLEHGYLDWAQYVPDAVVQAVGVAILVLLLAFVFFVVYRARRANAYRPGYVTLLSGYRGPKERLVCGVTMPVDLGERKRKWQRERVRRLVQLKLGQHVYLPWLLGGMLGLTAALAVLHSLWPALDLEQWWMIALGLAGWGLLLLPIVAVFARALIRRKGVYCAVKFLFPEAIEGKASRVDELGYRLIGLRKTMRNIRETKP